MPDRIQIKEEAKQVVRGARVNAYLVTLIVLAVTGLLEALDSYVGASRTRSRSSMASRRRPCCPPSRSSPCC